MKSVISFRHSGNIGDVIWALPTIISLLQEDQKAIIYLQANVRADYLRKIRHPCGSVMMTTTFADQLAQLLNLQSYIEKAELWNNQPFDIDLDSFRRTGFDHRLGDIGTYYAHVFACMPRLDKQWLDIEDEKNDFIFVNRTCRYRNTHINYDFLRKYDNVRFLGLRPEYTDFIRRCAMPWFETPTLLDMVKAIKGCRLFIGNQSVGLAIAQSMHIPRVMEICPFMPNVQMHGPNGIGALTQHILEDAVELLLNNTSKKSLLVAS